MDEEHGRTSRRKDDAGEAGRDGRLDFERLAHQFGFRFRPLLAQQHAEHKVGPGDDAAVLRAVSALSPANAASRLPGG